MLLSMTGFGKASASINGYTYEVEMKSINNRYLEFSFKLPAVLQNREFEIREVLRSKMYRGKIYIMVNVSKEGAAANSYFLNEEKLNELLPVLNTIKAKTGTNEEISISHILQFRELFSASVDDFSDEHFEAFKSVLVQAISELQRTRGLEGTALKNDLLGRVQTIETTVNEIEGFHNSSLPVYFNTLRERLDVLIRDRVQYEDRFAFELALIAEKADISEECVRLRSHLAMFRKTLEEGNDVGRKLNFLCQEMHREATTIASKGLVSDIIHRSILIREEIERIREQVQNIE